MQPKLRFPKFSGDWYEKKCLDIAPLQRGFDLPVANIQEGKYPVVFSNGINKYHNEFKVKAPGVVTGRSGTIGTLTYVEEDYWPHNTSLWVTDFKGNNSKFIYYFYQVLDLNKYATGSGVPTLNRNDIHNIVTYIPNAFEQTKIADFLSTVDKKITLLEQQQQAWQNYKQGMMQKLFSGELRFKDENGQDFADWKKSIVGNECVITTGNKDTQNKIDDGQYPFFVRSQTVENINTYSMDCEAILTSGDGVGVGKNYHYINGKFDFHQRVYCLYDFSERIIGKYLFVYFSNFFFDRVKRLSAKNSVDSVRMDMISKMEVMVPCLEEQQKIADCLSGLDDKINNITEQLEKMREWKKGLLQQMFV